MVEFLRVDLEKIPPVDCLKALLLVLEALIEDEDVQVRLSPLPVWSSSMEWPLTTIKLTPIGPWVVPHSGE